MIVKENVLNVESQFGFLSINQKDLHRQMKRANEKRTGLQGRILVIGASADTTTHYIRMMNATFAAQKLHVPIDVCLLHSTDSVFLQQASYMTRGIYSRVEGLNAFLCLLMVSRNG